MNSLQNILVCVTQQKNCERLIRKADNLRNEFEGELFVIHVAKNGWNFLDNAKEGEALEYLFSISKSVGANLSVLKSENVVKTIVDFAKEHKIGNIIMGESSSEHNDNNFFKELRKLLHGVNIRIIPQNEM